MTVPAPTAAEQLRRTVGERSATDYVFNFWTAFGWTVLSLGLYSFYVFYRMIQRSRDHNRRRADLLQAANEIAWDRAVDQGRAEAMRPQFEQIGRDVQPLRSMTGDFREPALWLLFSIVGGGLVWLAGAILIDQDLVRHERHERAAAAGITEAFTELGVSLPVPTPATKQPHNYVGRIIAVVFTLGLYSLWWVADLMREGNANFQQDDAWEDALVRALAAR